MTSWVSLLIIVLVALLQLGTILKKEDPILKTQSDAVPLQQREEELKEGAKGAPTPSFKYYKRQEFLTNSPMQVAGESPEETAEEGSEEEDSWFELEEGEEAAEGEENWWIEDLEEDGEGEEEPEPDADIDNNKE